MHKRIKTVWLPVAQIVFPLDKMAPLLGLKNAGSMQAFPQNKKVAYQNTKQR
ncbi:hypothetical protein LSS_05613 [Leptospira santarosai serovar Shermani str. LT 821]|uniref:Uncharacterized protein n=2 Tax=Leptospira santarosai TaxID=28183 RepID=K8YBJ1_9LEPT|nr:hypothetical protein LSS_05613 [Leptospira santarosai serovar Shermani str. LT 821]EMN21326.1 hypothetical protein LEP1GSC063_0419 [Leptospira santarosai serovar Arenal str. MAVJ 401]